MFEELTNSFGLKVHEKQIDKISGMPLLLNVSRKYYQLQILDVTFLVICLSESDQFGVLALKKQLNEYQEKTGLLCAYSFDTFTKRQRNSLISHEIPFICLPEQVYLPFLGVVLANKFRNRIAVNREKMMPATQILFLYLFYSKENEITKSDAAEGLHLTNMSITRASKQLLEMGLIEEMQEGRKRKMKCVDTGLALYEKAKPYLISPVKEIRTILKIDDKSCVIAGESALGKYTMLNEPRTPVYAISKDKEIVKTITDINPKWEDQEEHIVLQLWKYDPFLFSKNGCVDPISLICSFANEEDERIEIALDELLEEYEW